LVGKENGMGTGRGYFFYYFSFLHYQQKLIMILIHSKVLERIDLEGVGKPPPLCL